MGRLSNSFTNFETQNGHFLTHLKSYKSQTIDSQCELLTQKSNKIWYHIEPESTLRDLDT